MPVIVVSARTHEKDKVEALDLGADDYITKPFGTSELLARIRTAIRHSRAAFLNQGGAPTAPSYPADSPSTMISTGYLWTGPMRD